MSNVPLGVESMMMDIHRNSDGTPKEIRRSSVRRKKERKKEIKMNSLGIGIKDLLCKQCHQIKQMDRYGLCFDCNRYDI